MIFIYSFLFESIIIVYPFFYSRKEFARADGRWLPNNVLATMQILSKKCIRQGKLDRRPWIGVIELFDGNYFMIYFHNLFAQIRTFFKLKQKHANLYEDLYPNSVRHVYEQELVKLIPMRDRNGSRILWIECGSM